MSEVGDRISEVGGQRLEIRYLILYILNLISDFCLPNSDLFYGRTLIIVSSKPDIIGIDIDIIITFPPISILLAIAVSPESLQMLTANSVKNAIPVIFISKPKN